MMTAMINENMELDRTELEQVNGGISLCFFIGLNFDSKCNPNVGAGACAVKGVSTDIGKSYGLGGTTCAALGAGIGIYF